MMIINKKYVYFINGHNPLFVHPWNKIQYAPN